MGHVERPGLVWINAPSNEQSDKLLKEVRFSVKPSCHTLFSMLHVACSGGDDEP